MCVIYSVCPYILPSRNDIRSTRAVSSNCFSLSISLRRLYKFEYTGRSEITERHRQKRSYF